MSFVKMSQVQSADFIEGIDQIKTGDFNGDGKTDFVVARVNYQDLGTSPVPLQLFLGNGTGNFSDETLNIFGNQPYVHYVARMIVADFNNDGISDFFCIDTGIDKPPFSGGQNRIFLSKNNSLEDATNLLPQGLRSNHGASVADIDRDGRLDILVNALMSDGNELLINDGIAFRSIPELLPPQDVPDPYQTGSSTKQTNTWSGLIDLNSDSFPDLILGNWDNLTSPKYTQIFFNDKTGSFSTSTPINVPNTSIDQQIVLDIKALDLNGDILPDLALSVTNGGDFNSFYRTPYLQLLVNKGDGIFIDETASRFPQNIVKTSDAIWYKSIEVTDFNRDGFNDLFLCDAGFGSSKVLINNGHGIFNSVFETLPFQKSAIGDFNNDGMVDIILSDASSIDGFTVYQNIFSNMHKYVAKLDGDNLLGSTKNDFFFSGPSSDQFIGNGGLDVVNYNLSSDNYTLSSTSNGWLCLDKSQGKEDSLNGISRVIFSDKILAIDIQGNAGQAFRLYQAALDRTPDERGLAGWIKFMDEGGALTNMAQQFIDSQEFRTKYGALDDRNFINQLYLNVLDRNGEPSGINGWVGGLANGLSRADVLKGFSESSENQANVIGQIKNGIPYVEWWLN
jgi:hypothetical protein